MAEREDDADHLSAQLTVAAAEVEAPMEAMGTLLIEDTVEVAAASASTIRKSPPVQRLQRSASGPSLRAGRSVRKASRSSPFASSIPFVGTRVHPDGSVKYFDNTCYHPAGWGVTAPAQQNELLPKRLRRYFSYHAVSVEQLKQEVSETNSPGNSRSLLKRLDEEEVPWSMPSKICPDAGAPILPMRHTFGGEMHDRDGYGRPWNDRWHMGIHTINADLHPLHRGAFTQTSLFECAPSQQWRRNLDMEIEHGVWHPIAVKKPARFPPLGV